MVGEDLTSSQFEAPPRKPIDLTEISREYLSEIGVRIINGTWEKGLQQWSWGEGVFMLGATNFYRAAEKPIDSRISEWYQKYSDPNSRASGHVNNVAPGAAAATILSEGAPYYQSICAELNTWVHDEKNCTRTSNGAIEHWPGGVWADTCYMVGTFLARYGIAQQRIDYIEELGEQIVAHAHYLLHPEKNLFAHGSHNGETIWSFWGRGNAWMALAAVEYLEAITALGVKGKYQETITKNLLGQFAALIELLPEYGIWDVLVDGQVENKGILETSASAGIASALFRASLVIPHFPSIFKDAGKRALAASLSYVDSDGIVTRVSAGTVLQLVPFGYSVIRNDRMQLWGQGLQLSAIAAALQLPEYR